jgi:hypothetical protein
MTVHRNLLFSAVAGVIAAGALSVTAHAQATVAEGDSWDTGPGTRATTVSDPAINPNGVDTGVVTTVGNGVVVTLTEAGGGVSDYIYSFGAPGTSTHIWFLSDTQGNIALPPQLNNIALTTTSMTETGSFQALTNNQGQNIFGTAFRVRSDLDPVPEPAAWAMMILGFGLAGAVLRRQRARFAF